MAWSPATAMTWNSSDEEATLRSQIINQYSTMHVLWLRKPLLTFLPRGPGTPGMSQGGTCVSPCMAEGMKESQF
jgi:hypothetical protein